MPSLDEEDIIKILNFKERRLSLYEFRKIIKGITIRDMYYNVSGEFIIVIVFHKLGIIIGVKIEDLERR